MLTGKAKKDFEKWYFEKQINREENKLLTNESKNVMAISNLSNFFPLLDNSMQHGVYVDFFLEKTKRDLDKSTVYYTKGYGKEKARVKAIEEENEIYNIADKRVEEIKEKVIKKYDLPSLLDETKKEAMKRLGVTNDWGVFYNPKDYTYYRTKNYNNDTNKK